MSLVAYDLTRGRHACTCMVLARDNIETIRRTLDSAIGSGCFDEILVLIDVRSIDGTGRVIYTYKRRGAPIRIIPYKWSDPPQFDAARNYQMLFVRTPYAFWLDGDEEITDPAAIRRMLDAAKGEAFWMTVRSPLASGGIFDMYQPRLFPMRPGVVFECPAFERIDWSLRRQGVPFISTKTVPILHHGYKDRAAVRLKNQRNFASLRDGMSGYRGGASQLAHMHKQYEALRGR